MAAGAGDEGREGLLRHARIRQTVVYPINVRFTGRMTAHPKARTTREDGPRGGRPFIGFRIRNSALERLDSLAEETATSRSEVIRACLALGFSRRDELTRLLKEQA